MKLMSILTEAKEQDFKRLPLSYKLSALNPIIDTDTMEEHYKKHYKGYTDKFNAACKEFKYSSDKHGYLNRAIDILSHHCLYKSELKSLFCLGPLHRTLRLGIHPSD